MQHHSLSIRTLREAAVLGLAVEGAELVVRTASGGALLVSDRPAPEDVPHLTPCELRTAVLRATEPEGAEALAGIVGVDIGGALHDLGGGLHACRAPRSPEGSVPSGERWFASCLTPRAIARAIDRCDLDLPSGAMNARVLTDPGLCASAVVVRVDGIAHADRLDEAARWLLDACLVEELLSATADPTVRRP